MGQHDLADVVEANLTAVTDSVFPNVEIPTSGFTGGGVGQSRKGRRLVCT
jgi:hypothetical protein